MRRGTIVQFTEKKEKFDLTDRFMVIGSLKGHAIWMSDTGMIYDSEDVSWKSRNYRYETTVIGLD